MLAILSVGEKILSCTGYEGSGIKFLTNQSSNTLGFASMISSDRALVGFSIVALIFSLSSVWVVYTALSAVPFWDEWDSYLNFYTIGSL